MVRKPLFAYNKLIVDTYFMNPLWNENCHINHTIIFSLISSSDSLVILALPDRALERSTPLGAPMFLDAPMANKTR